MQSEGSPGRRLLELEKAQSLICKENVGQMRKVLLQTLSIGCCKYAIHVYT